MNPDDFLLLMRVPRSQSSRAAESAIAGLPRRGAAREPSSPAPSSRENKAAAPIAPSGAAAAPLQCSWLFCDKPATDGDCCDVHADKVKDIRKDWEDRAADFEDGWL